MSLKLYRPGPGGLEPAPVVDEDYRTHLRSRRWRLPPLENTEAEPASALGAVILFGLLTILTFVILVAGYASGFWAV